MDDGKELVAYLAGKLRLKNINVYVGDRVEVVLDPNGGHATHRIVWRH
jgi:translation initiation factor IF-1